jgi:8-oxo-dGTP diphosphatase
MSALHHHQHHVRVGVGCFVLNDEYPRSFLFGERKGSHGAGKFALPGGHLELGESWEECATREVKEETNLDITDIRFVSVTVSSPL